MIEVLLGHVPTYWKISEHGEVEEIPLSKSPYLDHLHLYKYQDGHAYGSNVSSQGDMSVPFHIDNGMFLLLTPSQVSKTEISVAGLIFKQ
jgi:hypothetical protein